MKGQKYYLQRLDDRQYWCISGSTIVRSAGVLYANGVLFISTKITPPLTIFVWFKVSYCSRQTSNLLSEHNEALRLAYVE